MNKNLVDNKDGTITDKTTNLMWQQKASERILGWNQAISYCKELTIASYTDWRLPTVKELISIVDFSQNNPSIDTKYFQNTVSDWYWSSTINSYNTENAWSVDFYYGYINYYDKYNLHEVRAVRGTQYEIIL